MAITRQERMYEILVRYGRDAAGDLFVAAHQRRIIEFIDSATGKVDHSVEGDAVALNVADVEDVVGETLPALVAQVAELQAHLTAAAEEKSQALQAAAEEKGAALQQAATAAAQDKAAALQQAAQDKAAALAVLQAQIDALTAPPSVAIVSRMQARLALLQAGLLDDVDAAVAAAGREVQEYWANVSELHRDHPLLAQLTAQLGLTSDQVDALFSAAKQIV